MIKKYSVYLVGALNRGGSVVAVKIGVATDMARRMETLQTGNHCGLVLLAEYPTKGRAHAYDVENHTHKVFRSLHLRGEWFQGRKSIKRYMGFIEGKGLTSYPILEE